MKISIITVCYNSEKYIKTALESVLQQTYFDLEHIIIDGGSTDSTIGIIKDYEPKFSGRMHWICEPDKGIYDAMNKGVKMATGDVIAILNSDDLYQDNNVLNDVMNCFISNLELDILYGDIVYVKNINIGKVIRFWKLKPYTGNFFENGNMPAHPALFLKKKVYVLAGYYDLQYKLAADYDFMFRIFKKHHFTSLYFSRLLVRMRLGGASNANLKSTITANREVLKTWSNHGFKIPIQLLFLRILKRFIQFI